MKPIYLDYNATTPIDPRVVEAMLPYINEHFGNPSSSHAYGTQTKMAVEKARQQVANMLKCGIEEIIFTSGGSESNNYAIKGAVYANRQGGNHIITSAIEHPAVTEVCRHLETQGFKVTWMPVDEYGIVDPQQVKEAITPLTSLITIMHANNEVGAIQPIKEIAAIAHQRDILIHSDCAQSIGKIPVSIDELGVDMLSIAGHKLYAPKGVGALYIRNGVKLEKQIHGADHEMNQRAGTENVIHIVGLGKACELVTNESNKVTEHLGKMRDRLENRLLLELPGCRVNGHIEKRLLNTSSISFKGLEANTIVSELSDKVAVSAGAACHSEHVEVSAVLQAMKIPLEYAMGTIRFSVGRFTTVDEIDKACSEIIKLVKQLTPSSAADKDFTEDDIKLTRYTHGLGCACKLRPQLLEQVLQRLPIPKHENILVGAETSDDAAVYKIDDQTAIIQTVDFFTPIVDDPFHFGAIAAANSLSDIYAMGGKPLFALNVVGFPSNRLPVQVLQQILDGAHSIAVKAGISIIGGHTVDDTEPKFGLAVTGIVHPDKIVRNYGAQPGDQLILTKPLGTGIMSTALKEGKLDRQQTDLLISTMEQLNDQAAMLMQEFNVHACTDITGFGLLGHLMEMMKASKTTAQLYFEKIPILRGVYELAVGGAIPGGTRDNYTFTASQVQYPHDMSEIRRLMLNDAQTSGGLLIAAEKDQADKLAEKIPQAVIIGEVMLAEEIYIRIE